MAASAALVMEAAGTWSTAKLSVARDFLSATLLPCQGLALFAGGEIGECIGEEVNVLSVGWDLGAVVCRLVL